MFNDVGVKIDWRRIAEINTCRNGKLLWHSGELRIVKLGIVALENLLEKEMQRSHPVLDGSGRQFLIPQHVQLELAKFFDAQLVRRLVVICGEVANGADVVADRAESKVAPLESHAGTASSTSSRFVAMRGRRVRAPSPDRERRR